MVRTFQRTPADTTTTAADKKPAAGAAEKGTEKAGCDKGGCPELPITYGFMVPVTITSHAYADCKLGGGSVAPDPKPPCHNVKPAPDPVCTTAQFHSWPLAVSAGHSTSSIVADGQCHHLEFDDNDGASACEPGNNNITLYGIKTKCGLADWKAKGGACTEDFKLGTIDACQSQDFECDKTQHFVYAYTASPAAGKPGAAAPAPAPGAK